MKNTKLSKKQKEYLNTLYTMITYHITKTGQTEIVVSSGAVYRLRSISYALTRILGEREYDADQGIYINSLKSLYAHLKGCIGAS